MWGLALTRTDSILPWILSLKKLIRNSQKRLHRHLNVSCEWHIWEKFTSPDPGLSVWEEIHLGLMAQECGVSSHKVYGDHTIPFRTLSHSVMEAGRWATPSYPAPWRSDSSQTQKWNKSIVAYGEDQTTAQHDNDHKSTQALWLPPKRNSFK